MSLIEQSWKSRNEQWVALQKDQIRTVKLRPSWPYTGLEKKLGLQKRKSLTCLEQSKQVNEQIKHIKNPLHISSLPIKFRSIANSEKDAYRKNVHKSYISRSSLTEKKTTERF